MFVVQICCLYLVNRLLYGVLPETAFFTKTAEHDLSLTSVTFDLERPRVKFLQRMRRIDARRGTEHVKSLFPTEFELLTKNHQGQPFGPAIRSRVKTPTNFPRIWRYTSSMGIQKPSQHVLIVARNTLDVKILLDHHQKRSYQRSLFFFVTFRH